MAGVLASRRCTQGQDLRHVSTLINSLIVFALTAATIYFLLIVPNQKTRMRRGVPPAPPTEVDLLTEIRDLLSAQQAARSTP